MFLTPSIESRVMARVRSVIAEAQENLNLGLTELKNDLKSGIKQLRDDHKGREEALVERHVQTVFKKII